MGFWDETTKRILKKLGGDIISGKVLTWDGDKSNEKELGDGMFVVRIADYIDLTKVESIKISVYGLETATIQKSQFTAEVTTEGDLAIGSLELDSTLILIATSGEYEGLEAGTYVISTGSPHTFISATTPATMSDTIVPIDPKYLPGVCLPVVELETVISDDSAEIVLSAADAAKMDALNGEACILNFTLSSGGFSGTTRYVVGSLGIAPLFYYQAVTLWGSFNFTNDTADGAWVCAKVE